MTDADEYAITDVEVGPDDPATGVSAETLRSGLTAEDSSVRLQAANVASFVPPEEAETLEAVVPELLALLSGEPDVTSYQSVVALKVLSDERPAALAAAIPELVGLLDHDLSLIRSVTATALANVAMERPADVAGEVDTLIDVTVTRPDDAVERADREDPELERGQRESLQALNWEEEKRTRMAREVAANLLVEVAEHDPSLVAPRVDELVGVLETGPLPVRTAVADVVGQIAREDPDAVAGAVEPLVDVLEAENVSLVATAVTALGFIGDPDAVEPLRDLAADEERDEDLRDLAGETAEFIAA